MIIRILGEGQYDVPDSTLDLLNKADDRLTEAVEAGDVEAFTTALAELLVMVRAHAAPHRPDTLDPSDCVLPGPDSSLEEVRALLSGDGLVPD